MMRRPARLLAVLAVAGIAAAAAAVSAVPSRGEATAAAATSCQLSADGKIKHLVYLQFDNTHFNRDRADVPSDLEQMPHLLNFLTSNGTLFTNDHTILISHTAGGILASLTGLYPDRNGQTVSNSYDYYRNNGTPTFTSSFKYWTAPVDGADDPNPNMITDTGKTTPAPWVPFTRAGCDVGGVGTANIELENNSTAPGGDICNVYGCPSPEASEPPAQRTTDFVGIAIHCAQTTGSKCTGNTHAKSDPLPDEPGGYVGFQGLFGTKYVDPAITGGNACVNNTSGQPITDSGGNCGFPGFDGMLAKNSLGYVAQMQEAGVPVTYAYISDAHDNHTLARASGPGEADYKQQLADYDAAFAAFFQRLQADGIDKSNTLFVVTVDEGDHFAGGTGSPDGSGNLTYAHTACPLAPVASSCPANQIGEVNVKIGAVLPAGEPAFDIHFDDAPTFYVNGDAAHPNGPARTDPSVRQLERDVWNATAPDPYAGGGATPIAQFLADPVEEKALHMVNADPKRTPTFTMFGNPDFFFQTTNLSGGCTGSTVCVNPGFAWNHGDVQDEIANTWVGFVGPGVQGGGIDSNTWTDHTNVRPTILTLLGLKDDYVQDGRALVEALTTQATPHSLVAHRETVRRLGDVYEQLNASFGSFALDTLTASTKALASSDESKYASIEGSIASLTSQRDALAAQIRGALNAAAFDGTALDEQQAKGWIDQAQSLIDQASSLAASS
jgi:type II secretory pathway pseudopilin PulG